MQRPVLAVAVVCAVLALPPAAADNPLPEQVHVTLAQDDGPALVVQWAVSVEYPASDAPHVVWRIDGEEEQTTPAEPVGLVEAQPSPYGGYAEAPHPTHIYAATLEVGWGERVTYSVGSPTRGHAGPFTIDQVPGPDEALRFVAYGDIGRDSAAPDGSPKPLINAGAQEVSPHSPQHQVRDRALSHGPDLLVIPGDLAYSGLRSGWDTFMRFMQPISATVPTMPVAGNHEWESDEDSYWMFEEEYVLPGNEHEYTFQAGPVTFIALNSDTVCGTHKSVSSTNITHACGDYGEVDQEQLAWLESALQQAQNDTTPWTVAVFHHPVYSWGEHGPYAGYLDLWVPLFERYGVDLVLTAHDHLYSRSHAVLAGEVTDTDQEFEQGEGIVYVVTGGGGRFLYDLRDEAEAPPWHAIGREEHHLSLIDADAERISFQALRADDGEVLDAFTIEASTPLVRDEDGPDRGSPMPALVAVAALALAIVASRRRR